MPTINRESGLQITLPEDYQVPSSTSPTPTAPPTRRGRLGGARGAVPMPPAAVSDPVAAAFEQQEMQLLDKLELAPQAGAPAKRARGARSGEAEFSVPLGPDESAVVLLEQGGMYTWQLPEETPGKSARAVRGVKRGATAQGATFRITLPDGAPAAPSAKRGIVGNFVREKITAHVFKFAARVGVQGLVKFLERHARTGIVNMNNADAGQWEFIDDLTNVTLPADRPARILLFIHGTFSSTIGGFGALTATPWGEKFLEGARANYDAVLGFDHPTLSVDPFANATELLKRLEGHDWQFAPQIDIVTHSRGGLVTRTLIEQLLPMSPLKPRIGQVIFVAATNGGTRLASSKNWKDLIDIYTNLAAGASKLLMLLPKANLAGVILNEAVQSLGALVKFAAAHTLTDEGVPGLAAMQPDGPFVKQINETQPGQLSAQQSFYFAVTSQFKARLTGQHQPSELPARLLQLMGTGFMSELMRESNDLVVNTVSMITIDPHAGKFIKDSLDFSASPQVYHTNYFLQPKVVDALTRWLGLIEPAQATTAPVASAKRSVRGVRGANGAVSKAVRPGALATAAAARRSAAGASSGTAVPAVVDTDILIVDADDSAAELRRMLEERIVSFVVPRRVYEGDSDKHKGKIFHYGFKYEEALEFLRSGDSGTVLDALLLREDRASETRTVNEPMTPLTVTGGPPTKRRCVILANNQPVGVLPESVEPLTAEQIADLARKTDNPKTVEDRAAGRRAMPTFAPAVEEMITTTSIAEPQAAVVRQPQVEIAPGGAPRRRGARSGRPTSFGFPTAPPPAPAPAKPAARAKPAPAAKATCFFQAAMDEEVIVKRPTLVEVTVSREEIERVAGMASSQGKAEVAVDRKIVIQVIPKKNFELMGEGVEEIDLPVPHKPTQLVFNLRPTNAGDGEVWVKARQGQVDLVKLKLKTQVVAAANAGQAKGRTVATQTAAEAKPLESPLHMLEIFDLTRFGKSAFQFTFESPKLGIRIRRESNPINGDVQQYIADLYQKIEQRWLSTNQDFDDFTEEMRALGVDLFEQLIPKDLQQALWDNRDQIGSIRVISTEPFVPWEMVHLKQPGKSLPPETRFLGQMGLVRWLDLDSSALPPEQLQIRKGRARYVIPNYPHPDYVLPEALEEAKFLTKAFGATAIAAKSSDVRRLISQPGAFDLLHFACHGEADSNKIAEAQLLMEGRVEAGQFVIDALTETVVNGFANLQAADNRPLVVLNACQAGRAGHKLTGMGGFAQAFLQHGAGAFVGALWSVGDAPARSFTESLYAQLRKGATLSEATIAAREEARKAGDATWLAYVVYGHPHLRLM